MITIDPIDIKDHLVKLSTREIELIDPSRGICEELCKRFNWPISAGFYLPPQPYSLNGATS